MFHLSKIVDGTTKGSLKGTKLNVAVRTQKTKQKKEKKKEKKKGHNLAPCDEGNSRKSRGNFIVERNLLKWLFVHVCLTDDTECQN